MKPSWKYYLRTIVALFILTMLIALFNQVAINLTGQSIKKPMVYTIWDFRYFIVFAVILNIIIVIKKVLHILRIYWVRRCYYCGNILSYDDTIIKSWRGWVAHQSCHDIYKYY